MSRVHARRRTLIQCPETEKQEAWMITKERIGEVENVLTAFDQLSERVLTLLNGESDQPGDPESERSSRAGTIRKIAGDLRHQRELLDKLWS